MNNKRKGLSGSDLKIIAIAAMLIDHLAATLLYQSLVGGVYRTETAWNAAYYTYDILRLVIGRIAFPIFCFLLVQGFLHTGSRLRYAARLLLFAFISEIPFDLAFNQPTDGIYNSYTAYGLQFLEFDSQNVFFTLFLGLLVMILSDLILRIPLPASMVSQDGKTPGKIRNTVFRILKILLLAAVLICGVCAADFLRTDYGGYGVLVIAVLYYLNPWPSVQTVLGSCTLILGDCILNGSLTELLAPIGLILTKQYNGERGLTMKYFFYLFYPLHLLVLAVLRTILFPL